MLSWEGNHSCIEFMLCHVRRHISQQSSPTSGSQIIFFSAMFPEPWGWGGACDTDVLIRATQLQLGLHLFHIFLFSFLLLLCVKQDSIILNTRGTLGSFYREP